MVTLFKSLYQTTAPEYITVDEALARIERGDSLSLVHQIRGILDKEKRDSVKRNLPSVCFSGTFKERKAEALIEHSGFMIIDFDDVGLDYRAKLEACEYCYACWLSPSGNGFKMLIRIHSPKEHGAHFVSFQKNIFPEADSSGKDVGRVCFESYDPEIYINKDAKVYTHIHKEVFTHKVDYNVKQTTVEESFNNLLKWLTNKGGAFASGQRNTFIFTLAGACCRFGIHEQDCYSLIENRLLVSDGSFTKQEAERTIKSAYKTNANLSGNASFNDAYKLVTAKSGIEVDLAELEKGVTTVRDIIYSDDVKEGAVKIVMYGYEQAECTGVKGLDFKFKRGDVTLLSGIGNYGKTTFLNYLLLTKSIKDGDKWAIFSPESYPAEEYYHDLTEMVMGRAINGHINHGVSNDEYLKAYDWIGKHFFYIYPKEDEHTPEFLLERALELIIKENVTGVIIDPFNQMSNDYNSEGGRDDKYLEKKLGIFSRFAKENSQNFIIVAHPKAMKKGSDGKNYECPDVFDIANGAMWNNKMDNILVFHKPFAQSDPSSKDAEFHKKKIKRQKVVGQRGMIMLQFDYEKRRFYVDGIDYMAEVINAKKGIAPQKKQDDIIRFTDTPPFVE